MSCWRGPRFRRPIWKGGGGRVGKGGRGAPIGAQRWGPPLPTRSGLALFPTIPRRAAEGREGNRPSPRGQSGTDTFQTAAALGPLCPPYKTAYDTPMLDFLSDNAGPFLLVTVALGGGAAWQA